MNPNVVAGLVNRAYNNFDMFSFENRLKIQKFTYIMQSFFGLNIGYEFNWYHYGPYCMELTRDAFNVNFSEIPPLKFSDEGSERKFIEFLKVIKGKDNDWLEIVASIHFLKKIGQSKEEIIENIKNKREYLIDKEEEIREIYKQIEVDLE